MYHNCDDSLLPCDQDELTFGSTIDDAVALASALVHSDKMKHNSPTKRNLFSGKDQDRNINGNINGNDDEENNCGSNKGKKINDETDGKRNEIDETTTNSAMSSNKDLSQIRALKSPGLLSDKRATGEVTFESQVEAKGGNCTGREKENQSTDSNNPVESLSYVEDGSIVEITQINNIGFKKVQLKKRILSTEDTATASTDNNDNCNAGDNAKTFRNCDSNQSSKKLKQQADTINITTEAVENGHSNDHEQLDKNGFLNKELLLMMYKWTHFSYLNKIEQEILWLTEVSNVIVESNTDTAPTSNEEKSTSSQQQQDKSTEKLMFEYIQQNMSDDLKNEIEKCFRMKKTEKELPIINTKSLLIRKGIRCMHPNIKCEFIAKRKQAKIKIKNSIQSIYRKFYNHSLPRGRKIAKRNQRWKQRYHKRFYQPTFDIGEKIFLFEEVSSCDKNTLKAVKLYCYGGEILGYKLSHGEINEKNEINFSAPIRLYSILLSDSTVEHGIISQCIYRNNDIEEIRATLRMEWC